MAVLEIYSNTLTVVLHVNNRIQHTERFTNWDSLLDTVFNGIPHFVSVRVK